MTEKSITFADLDLIDALQKALIDKNFLTPSPIQQETIPLLLEGRDLIGLAQTGTGKTAAFGLPILQRLCPNKKHPQALVLAPTRELAIQVADHLESLCKYMKNVRVTVLCGGQDYRPQLQKLREGVQIVVGTPGRILDHIDRATLNLSELSTFVLDEADEMLRMGFIEDVETILAKLPEKRQIALFSATMPSRIRQIAQRYLDNPASVEIRMDTATVKSIEQRFLFASQPQKPDALLRILAVEEYQGVIVFVRTKNSTEEVAEILQKQGYRAMAIHGDITQTLRERIVAQFKSGAIDILIATDVAARGLDVERVTHVINYDMAHDCETYVHRVGRTGRAGRSGVTILFATPRESRMLTNIERHTRQRIEKVTVPTDYMIQTARQQRFMANITARLEHDNLPSYRNIIEEHLKNNADVSAVDVAATLALLLNKDKPWDQKFVGHAVATPAKEARVRSNSSDSRSARSYSNNDGPRSSGGERRSFRDDPAAGDRRPSREDVSSASQELYRIDVGRVHGVKPGNIVGAIANEAGLQSRFITGLKINDDHSTVRLPKGLDKDLIHGLNKAWVCGRQLKLTSLGAA